MSMTSPPIMVKVSKKQPYTFGDVGEKARLLALESPRDVREIFPQWLIADIVVPQLAAMIGPICAWFSNNTLQVGFTLEMPWDDLLGAYVPEEDMRALSEIVDSVEADYAPLQFIEGQFAGAPINAFTKSCIDNAIHEYEQVLMSCGAPSCHDMLLRRLGIFFISHIKLSPSFLSWF